MEIFIALAGAGIAGLALLLQSKSPLPSQEDYNKAADRWVKDPKDPDANLVMGKYLAFVLGDYKNGMPFLSNSNDATLKRLGEHELDPDRTDTAAKKVAMGDEWAAAAKNNSALFRIFYDRASQWYAAAWPDLEGASKAKVRERGRKLMAARPPGAAKKALPVGWVGESNVPGSPVAELDGTVARLGSYSAKVPAADEKTKDSWSQLKTDFIPIAGKSLELSAHVLTDGTTSGADQVRIYFIGPNAAVISGKGPYIPVDLPFWNRIYTKVEVPENAERVILAFILFSKKGVMWVDDVSMKVDGKEVIKSPSFE